VPYIPAPENLPGFPDTTRTEPKGRRRRWVDRRGRIFEWDYQHGTVEMFDPRGRHLGEFDTENGAAPQGTGPDAMDRAITLRLVGYNRSTQRVAVEYDIPDKHVAFAKQVAKVGPDDPDAVLCYALSPQQNRAIAEAIGTAAEADALNFYMEGFAVEPARAPENRRGL
jgi:hypothetical protein